MYQIVVGRGNGRIFVQADHEETILYCVQDLTAGGIWVFFQ